MGISVFPVPAAASGLSAGRFPAASGMSFNVPAGLTLQNTVTSTTTFTAGQLPAQVWAVIVGAGGSGGANGANQTNAGGGGGGVVIGWVDIPSGGITATIGAGGTAVSGNSGNRGGTTYFGSLFASGGGGGGNQGSAILDTGNCQPLQGVGVPGWGGNAASAASISANGYCSFIVGAPWGITQGTWSIGASTASQSIISNMIQGRQHNYLGGGAGGWTTAGFGTTGGSGFTGGGGANGAAGGNSSRDGGLTNTFTGGTAATASGGGAGFLANGSNAVTTTGGAGGSGGGGGGAGGSGSNSGAGGNGCVLIYY